MKWESGLEDFKVRLKPAGEWSPGCLTDPSGSGKVAFGQPGRSRRCTRTSSLEIRKATRKKYSAEEKIRIVLEGLRGEIPILRAVSPGGDRPLRVVCTDIFVLGAPLEEPSNSGQVLVNGGHAERIRHLHLEDFRDRLLPVGDLFFPMGRNSLQCFPILHQVS